MGAADKEQSLKVEFKHFSIGALRAEGSITKKPAKRAIAILSTPYIAGTKC